ncbi:sodium-dependent bicarbonate transport family permease [Wenzhouxiangella limi]|uniref:Sodium-dependent bicarbonate transport family permease n=1 Tax=Wenzhouxiangella limi TaxID=2707351 RepID=A0A845V2D9_9GAMM|nr:sodium-dependent bicarbonate transport family permease [Wenzhouxiangella limi]
MLELAVQNLLSPIVLSFVLGLVAAGLRSDLSVPEAVAKGLSIYLLFAIGYKGGVEVAAAGLDWRLALGLLAGAGLSAILPLIAYGLLRAMSRLSSVDAAAVAGHYGSISIVTFVAAGALLQSRGVAYEGWLVAVAATMEAPAILTALWLAQRNASARSAAGVPWREVILNGSIVLLIGAFLIGWATGPAGMAEVEGFLVAPFKGVLCLFLLDMGLVAGRNLARSRSALTVGVVLFGLLMPLVGAVTGLATAWALGLSVGGMAILATLAASASYIAVPAAMRVALPEANPAIYLSLSLGVTFPFNLAVGITLYLAAATWLSGG